MASRRAGALWRSRAATPAMSTLARAMPPVTLSKGPTPWAEMKNVSAAPATSGDSGLSVTAMIAAPSLRRPTGSDPTSDRS